LRHWLFKRDLKGVVEFFLEIIDVRPGTIAGTVKPVTIPRTIAMTASAANPSCRRFVGAGLPAVNDPVIVQDQSTDGPAPASAA